MTVVMVVMVAVVVILKEVRDGDEISRGGSAI
jgi:hypothetical protein